GLRILLAQVTADIDRLAPAVVPTPVATASPLSPLALVDRLDLLEHALQYDLGAAEELLNALRAGVDAANAPAIQELMVKTDAFAIDEALALISALRKRLQSAT
ncbi:MAG: hypothetical protein WA136_09180, partial [Rhodoferax sp.]